MELRGIKNNLRVYFSKYAIAGLNCNFKALKQATFAMFLVNEPQLKNPGRYILKNQYSYSLL